MCLRIGCPGLQPTEPRVHCCLRQGRQREVCWGRNRHEMMHGRSMQRITGEIRREAGKQGKLAKLAKGKFN